MTTYHKATKPDGKDFYSGTIDYAGALESGQPITHPEPGSMAHDEAWSYLSISTEPAETLIGGEWPCRLFRVEPVGDVLDGLSASEYKRAVKSLRVVEELPAWQALGPNGEAVVALVERARNLTGAEIDQLYAAEDAARSAAGYAARYAAGYAARDAAGDAARDAARYAARSAARYATRSAARSAARYAAGYAAGSAAGYAAGYAARDAARDAAWALVVRDMISTEHYRILTTHWATVIGPVHPDDDMSMYEVAVRDTLDSVEPVSAKDSASGGVR